MMELHDGITQGCKGESKDGVSLSPSRRLLNLEDEIHLKGGRIVTPEKLHSFKIVKFDLFVQLCEHSNVGNNIFGEIKINNKE